MSSSPPNDEFPDPAAPNEYSSEELPELSPPPAFGTVYSVDDEYPPPAKDRPKPRARFVGVIAGGVGLLLVGTWFVSSGQLNSEAERGGQAKNEKAVAGGSEAESSGGGAIPVAQPPEPTCPGDMILHRGGRFFMGTDEDAAVLASAKPVHQVEVGDFCIDRFEVSVARYRECSSIGECERAHRESRWPKSDRESTEDWERARESFSLLCNEGIAGHEEHPVNCVSWEQARRYCEFRGGSLPFEIQWEYAARGSDGRDYPWGDEQPDETRMNGCGLECSKWREEHGQSRTSTLHEVDDGYPGTAPIGSYPAGRSESGLYDMAGNVFEWTNDLYLPYGKAMDGTDSKVTEKRVIRGGAFNSFMREFAYPALRFGQDQTAHLHAVGFRCVASPRSTEQKD